MLALKQSEKLSTYLKTRIFVDEEGCWIWKFGKDKDGYGKVKVGGKTLRAHRVSYMVYVGQIPDGMMIRHKCDKPSCINPGCLIPGTGHDNMQDMLSRNRQKKVTKTHCKRNHEYTEENTSQSGKWRRCIECRRIRGN